MKNKKPSLWNSLRVGLIALAIFIVYAYGFEITKINLQELQSSQRQESLIRVTRALARPDIITYEQTIQVINAPVYVPCPEEEFSFPEPDRSEPYIIVTPLCAAPGESVTVEGFNFAPNVEGPVSFIPGTDPENVVELNRVFAKTDSNGDFTITLQMPRRASEDVQFIRATMRKNVGAPMFTQTAKDTWFKIIETVFLALLATTLGTILAVPLSFIAARNLMKSVRSPLTSISLSTLGWPLGVVVGLYIVRLVNGFTEPLMQNMLVNIVSVAVSPVLILYATRWALPQVEIAPPSPGLRVARAAVIMLSVLVGFFGLYQFSGLVKNVGVLLTGALGSWAFLGRFFQHTSDIINILIPASGALAAGSTVSGMLGRIGQNSAEKLAAGLVKGMNLILAPLAGATVMALLGWLVEWLYQLERPEYTFWWPAAVGAGFGLILALLAKAKDALPIGLVVYTVTRTILNSLRSIEALVMAIVFVIAVGIGPFAGVLALGLHTIVSLAKLYSEQVESIMPGPLEAIQATGANRLQTIIYAVVPQIVPPYISYTMYRWDINVRMSTIIGFVGGGGIGFLLQQNINLLNYRAASAQMIAIAIVVSLMDYISSVIREKVV
jgi:phosphonate ABC transporter permease subunit PhnE